MAATLVRELRCDWGLAKSAFKTSFAKPAINLNCHDCRGFLRDEDETVLMSSRRTLRRHASVVITPHTGHSEQASLQLTQLFSLFAVMVHAMEPSSTPTNTPSSSMRGFFHPHGLVSNAHNGTRRYQSRCMHEQSSRAPPADRKRHPQV